MICDFFPNKYKPYEGTFFLNHAKVLRKIGKVKVQTLIRVDKIMFSYEKWNIEDIEAEAIAFFYKIGYGFIFFPLAIIFQFLLTLKNLILFRPDRIILQMALPHGLALIPFRFFKKIIILEHSCDVFNNISKFTYKIYNNLYVVSTFQKEEIEKKLKVKVKGIIPNPIFETNLKSDVNLKNRVICVGTITERKDQLLLLETAKILNNIKFVFVGKNFNDDYYKKFLNLASKLKNVVYLGPKDHNETLNEILNSDLLISTSKYETFGLAIAEALSLGKPVVWIDSGGPRDFLNEKNSILVRERNPFALKDNIIQAYEKLKKGYFDPKEIKKSIFEYCGEEKVINFYKTALY